MKEIKNKLSVVINNVNCKITGKTQTDLLIEKYSKQQGAFHLLMTGYTDTIINQQGEKIIIADAPTRNKVFIAAQKIKTDYKNSDIYLENIPKSAIRYYKLNEKEFYYSNAILIDLKAAYPTVLKNTGIITEKTYEYLMSLKKKERLKSIGMLASNKIEIEIENGVKTKVRVIEAGEFKEIYFYAAYEVGEILHKLSMINKKDFMFYWFDGIYLSPNWLYASEIIEELKKLNYQFSVSWLKDLKCEKNKNDNFVIQWTELTNTLKPDLKPVRKKITLPKKPKNLFR